MGLTQKKTQYALRAIMELAKHVGQGPIKVSEIARAQTIPLRFLEVILNQLKGSGLVKSKRGFYGGYALVRSPDDITVGDIFRFIQGPLDESSCALCLSRENCPFTGNCDFADMWEEALQAITRVFDTTTIQDLIDRQSGA